MGHDDGNLLSDDTRRVIGGGGRGGGGRVRVTCGVRKVVFSIFLSSLCCVMGVCRYVFVFCSVCVVVVVMRCWRQRVVCFYV